MLWLDFPPSAGGLGLAEAGDVTVDFLAALPSAALPSAALPSAAPRERR
jgi:hypothetical protein